jgi:DNA polymerase-1
MDSLSAGSLEARAFAENSAADVIKRAMIDLESRLEASDLAGSVVFQVHDELLPEVAKAELEETTELVRDCMANAVELDVPLVVDFDSGKNWLEAH